MATEKREDRYRIPTTTSNKMLFKAETAIQLSPYFRLAQLFFFFGKYY
jgi:hypothetical protein